MSTLRFIVLASLFTLACGGGEDGDDGPATIGSLTSTDPTTESGTASTTGDTTTGDTATGDTTAGDPCSPFIGCVKPCEGQGDQACIDACAEATGADAAACMIQFCAQLNDDCGMEVPDACEQLVSFCAAADTTAGSDESTSTGDETTSSSTGSSSTGGNEACEGYFACLRAGGTQDQCGALPGVDAEFCEDLQCMIWEEDCLEPDVEACELWLANCQPEGTSTGDTDGTTGDTDGTTSDSGGTTVDPTGKTT